MENNQVKKNTLDGIHKMCKRIENALNPHTAAEGQVSFRKSLWPHPPC